MAKALVALFTAKFTGQPRSRTGWCHLMAPDSQIMPAAMLKFDLDRDRRDPRR